MQKCRNWCIPHAFWEGKKDWETDARKSTARTLESIRQQHLSRTYPQLRPADETKIIDAFRALRDKEYDELMEECATKFVKEIEFERFRNNYTFEETEEIALDLEKIRRWFTRIVARDGFAAPHRAEAEAWIDQCQSLLDAFEHDVYEHDSRAHASQGPHSALQDHPRAVDVPHRLPCQRTPSPRSTATDASGPSL